MLIRSDARGDVAASAPLAAALARAHSRRPSWHTELRLVSPNPFIGLVVEDLIFRTIEQRTIRRWGMQH
jgi:hypothetical protein